MTYDMSENYFKFLHRRTELPFRNLKFSIELPPKQEPKDKGQGRNPNEIDNS